MSQETTPEEPEKVVVPPAVVQQAVQPTIKQVALDATNDLLDKMKTEIKTIQEDAVATLKSLIGKSKTEISDKVKNKLKKYKGRLAGLETLFGRDQIEQFLTHPLLQGGIDAFTSKVDQMVDAVDGAKNITITYGTLIKFMVAFWILGTVMGFLMQPGIVGLIG